MAASALNEDRDEHRNRVHKGGSILTGITNPAITCMVRNMHEHGAELTVHPDAHVPSEFLLYVPADGLAYRSVVRWRKNDKAGVQFTGTEPKPHWHYG